MTPHATQLASAMLHGLSGTCLFLVLVNRVFFMQRDGRLRNMLMFTAIVLLSGGGLLTGYLLTETVWITLPFVIFAALLAGELHRIRIRSRCAGSPPVDTVPHRVPLAAPITTLDLIVHRYTVPHPKWTGAPLRIAHLTDLHVNTAIPTAYYENVMAVAEQTRPDLAVFTGDFISALASLPDLKRILRPIAKTGNYAVMGNHDYWTGGKEVAEAIRHSGLHLLADETCTVSVAGNELILSGYDHPWGNTADHPVSPQPDLLHIVLSHTPDNIYKAADARADFLFGGHYHAGQIRLPRFGSIIVPSIYGRRFDHGHFVVGDTHLFVASGIGVSCPVLRLYCQPDILVVDIVPAGDS